jgi:steroid delta-isomerase-like uncharacterized protein
MSVAQHESVVPRESMSMPREQIRGKVRHPGDDRSGTGPGVRKGRIIAFCLLVGLTAVGLAEVGTELALAYRTPTAATGDREAKGNAELVAHFYAEVWNGDRVVLAERFVADDHRYHDADAPDVATGTAGFVQVIVALRRAFPDLVVTVDDTVARGDRVAVRLTARGTHRGTFLGVEGTNRAVGLTGVAVHRIADGQIAETWIWWDTFGAARQVGLVLISSSALAEWEGAMGQLRPGQPY